MMDLIHHLERIALQLDPAVNGEFDHGHNDDVESLQAGAPSSSVQRGPRLPITDSDLVLRAAEAPPRADRFVTGAGTPTLHSSGDVPVWMDAPEPGGGITPEDIQPPSGPHNPRLGP